MGIRFRCHHCEHELHVKDFQGGKRGRCPDCQGKFRIPLRDAEHSSDPDEASSPEDTSSDAEQPSSTPTPRQSTAPSQSVPSTPATGKSAVLNPASKPASSITKPASTATKPASTVTKPVSAADAPISRGAPQPAPLRAAAPLDSPAPPPAAAEASQPQALLDAPQATWFVRPPSGGQYGPAPSDSMWQWLCENRISRDSLVWCEGWPEWLVASQVFSDYFANNLDDSIAPSLATAATQSSAVAPAESSSAISSESQPTSLGDRNRAGRKQRRKRNYTVLIAILSVVMIALIVALVIVLTNQQAAA